MSDHVADKAGFLAALPKDDPERLSAEDHIRTCPPCGAALAEGRRLVTLLGEALPMAPPTPEALARTAAVIEKECRTYRRGRRILVGAIAGGFAAAWVVQLLVVPKLTLGAGRVAVSLAVLAATAAVVTLLRARMPVAVAALIGLSGLFAVFAGRVALLEPTIGVQCTLNEIVIGAIPWLAALLVARRKGIQLGRWDITAAAAGGALAAQAAQHLACPVPHADAHLLVFHFGGVMLAALGGRLTPLWSAPAAHQDT